MMPLQRNGPEGGPILRLFEATAKAGCGAQLMAKCATTSEWVRHVDLSDGWHVEAT